MIRERDQSLGSIQFLRVQTVWRTASMDKKFQAEREIAVGLY